MEYHISDVRMKCRIPVHYRFCSVPVGQLEYSESMDGLHTDDHEPLNSLTTVSGHAHIADRAIANFVNAIGRHFNDRELSDVTLKVIHYYVTL